MGIMHGLRVREDVFFLKCVRSVRHRGIVCDSVHILFSLFKQKIGRSLDFIHLGLASRASFLA